MISVGVIGASGYAGAELLRLVAGHPELEVELATGDTQAGTAGGRALSQPGRGLRAIWSSRPTTPAAVDGLDLCFLALPHGASQAIVAELRSQVKWVVDLAADFRLHDAALYPQWYGEAHTAPELLGELAYGLPELFRDQIAGQHGRGRAGLLSRPRPPWPWRPWCGPG